MLEGVAGVVSQESPFAELTKPLHLLLTTREWITAQLFKLQSKLFYDIWKEGCKIQM